MCGRCREVAVVGRWPSVEHNNLQVVSPLSLSKILSSIFNCRYQIFYSVLDSDKNWSIRIAIRKVPTD